MQVIVAPIQSGDSGASVLNLQGALLLMIGNNIIWPLDAPKRPSPEELQGLLDKLQAEREKSVYGETTQLVVRLFQIKQDLTVEIPGVVDEVTAGRLNQHLNTLDFLNSPDGYLVRGAVSDTNGKRIEKVIVQVFERDLRTRQSIGNAITNKNGEYSIDYKLADFQYGDNSKQRRPWLIVEVKRESGDVVLASQELPKAAQNQVLDFLLPGSSSELSEWQRISDLILPLLQGQGVSEVVQKTHNNARDLFAFELTEADIDFIIKDTELDAVIVRAWIASSQMQNDAVLKLNDESFNELNALRENGWPLFYAFARQGYANSLATTLGLSPEKWNQAWQTAVSANRVPVLDDKTLELLLSALNIMSRLQKLDANQTTDNDFAKLVATVDLRLSNRLALDALDIVQMHGINKPDELLNLLAAHPDERKSINTLVRAARLNQLVAGQTELLKTLNHQLDQDSDSIVPLAKLSASDWLGLGDKTSVKASDLMRAQANIEKQHPLLALRARVEDEQLVLPGVSRKEIEKIISEDSERADAVLHGKIRIKTGGVEPDSLKALQSLGQFVRTGITMEMAGKLMHANVTSPVAAVKYGRDYVGEILDTNGDNNQATEIVDGFFEVTESLVEAANTFLINIGNRHYPYGIAEDVEQGIPEEVQEVLPDVPAIFGDMDQCLCRPCESMLGLPAYLVDLLNLLKKSGTAFSVLNARRDDIAAMPLSCEKAEQVCLHIDIVLEILEAAIGTGPYLQTASAIYPWHLPFHRDRAETKAYLSKLDVTQLDLLARYVEISGAITAETLNLSMNQAGVPNSVSDWTLLTETRSGNALWAAYGFNATTVSIVDPISSRPLSNLPVQDVLCIVSVLLNRTGLNLDELDEIVVTKALGTINIRNREQCKTSEMLLEVPSVSRDLFFDRLHRFVRLKNKLLTWSIEELDLAIDTCGGFLTAQPSQMIVLLDKLATIKRVSDQYSLSLGSLLELPSAIHRMPKMLGLSERQALLLQKIVGIDFQSQTSMDWDALEQFCDARKRIDESGLSIEQIAEAKLTRTQLAAIYGALPVSLKAEQQIEGALKLLQQRLRNVVAVKIEVSLETQALEALTAIFDATSASKIIEAINSAGAKTAADRSPDAELLITLTARPQNTLALGDWLPLLPENKAIEILTVNASNKRNANERLELLLNGIAEKRRERELVLEVMEFSGLPEVDVVKMLSYRLRLDEDSQAGAPSAADSNIASKAFLSGSFWSGDILPSVTATAVPRLHTWLDRISRLSVLGKALALDSELMQIADLITVPNAAGGVYWRGALASEISAKNSWTNHWCALLDLIWLQRPEQLSRVTLNKLLGNLILRNEQIVLPETMQALAARFEITNDEALAMSKQSVAEISANSYASALQNPKNVRRIFEFLLLARKLKANAAQLAKLVKLSDNSASADTAKVLLHAKVGERSWPAIDEITRNPIRQKSRDALVAFLVHRDNFRDSNDLYEKYLIDPKIEACFETTRLLEAVTATQLFIQRVLFGLEINLAASTELKQRWTWMRNYRVWEANRKVFLFPENWLYPELRDDKSSSFNLLESALGQGELTKALAEETFGQFLDDVAQMGQIDVLGMYEDVLNPSTVTPIRNLYVVGRTPNPPYAYYWRKCIDFGSRLMEWAPWQRIELDIQGDHVMPFVLGGNLHVAWPIIKYNDQEAPKSSEWEVKLAWSRYDGRAWRKANISREIINLPDIAFMDERWGLSFRAKCNVLENKASIDVYVLNAISNVLKTKPPSTSSLGGSYIFPSFTSLQARLDFIKNIIIGNRSGTSTTEEYRAKYVDLPDGLRELFEAYWMLFGRWRSTSNNDITIEPHGDDPAYANFRVEGVDVFTSPVGAITKQTLLKNVHAHLRNVVFNNPNEPIPNNNSFEESLEHFVTKLIEKNLNDYYPIGFDNLAKKCSLRVISCEVWLRIKLSDNKSEDLVMLVGDEGQFNCSIEGQNLSPRNPVLIHKLGAQACPEYNLTFTYDSRQPPLTGISGIYVPPLTEIPNNTTHNQTLRFELDGRALTPEQLKFLKNDPNVSRTLSLANRFILTLDDNLSVEKNVQKTALFNPVGFSRTWMNGYEETTSAESSTVNPITILGAPILKSSPKTKFWTVGSATADSDTANVWHFSDSSLNAYVDLKYPSNSDLLVYADSYKDATQYRVNWSGGRLLSQPNLAAGSFSVKELFNIMVGFDNGSWLNDTKTWMIAHDKELAINDNLNYVSDLAFDNKLPYACYNWEVFFHAPLMIADQLSKQHKFEEAERWLRFVFDPTDHQITANDSRPFFKFKVFKELDLSKQVIDDLSILAKAASINATSDDVEEVKKLIDRWRDLPFRPFVIARRRHVAFLWRTLFAYLDNLISWADSLFRHDTRESINEAVMLYVLVEKILGRRPQQHDGKSKRTSASYNDLAAKWDDFANAWVSMGSVGESSGMRQRVKDPEDDSLGGMLYFCMPFNDKILSYWNIVDDRLFNVRHCLNIEGIERKLPFTDPPIDPELLIRATAAGLDLGDVISGLYAPPPHYRYGILSARASELASEAKALGAAMLSAMEKRDAEHLAQLRSSNEISMLKLVKEVRTLQITEAERNLDALRGSRRSVSTRYNQYQRLLGKKDIKVPAENQSAGEESMLGNVDGAASQHSSWGLIKEENEQYTGFEGANTWSVAANIAKIIGGASHTAASVLAAYPSENFTNAGKVAEYIANSASVTGDAFSMVSQGWKSYAEQQGMMAGHIRRRDEWAFQSNQTLKELQQIDKQILANEIRIAITKKELDNHIEQTEQTQAIDEVMRSKFSNVQLYEWMSKQLYSLYDKTYRMALDIARRAERAAARELGVKPLNILKNDYWDSLRMGLLAGERLHHDLKRLEITYLDQNRREYELTKHISLKRLNPTALIQLRTTQKNDEDININSCEFDIPEWLFDLDTPGQYLRRIKSVSISIPSVVGPYASINCKLTLLSSHIRHDKTSNTYKRDVLNDDPRFTDYYGASEAIVTSNANADSGMFETQLRDERFLPFEGSGVISRWRLELPADYPQWDYDTISDVIISIRYTAREGGLKLRNASTASIKSLLATLPTATEPSPFQVLLSCRSDFPTEWVLAGTQSDLKIPIARDLLPYWMTAANFVIREVHVADLLKNSVVMPTFELVPSMATPPPSSIVGKWWVNIPDQNGRWVVNLRQSRDGVKERFILLSVGKTTA
jgi:hypothetical protein